MSSSSPGWGQAPGCPGRKLRARYCGAKVSVGGILAPAAPPPPEGPGSYQGPAGDVVAAARLQSCPTLCDPVDGSPPGSSVPGILQARKLECGVPFPSPDVKMGVVHPLLLHCAQKSLAWLVEVGWLGCAPTGPPPVWSCARGDSGTLGLGGSSRAVTAACLVPHPSSPPSPHPHPAAEAGSGSAPARSCLGNLRCQ